MGLALLILNVWIGLQSIPSLESVIY